MTRRIDLTGKKINMLKIVKWAGVNKFNHTLWECVCDCGNICTKTRSSLISKNVKSCGCMKIDAGRRRIKHGRSNTPEYRAWRGIINRCYRKKERNYCDYGGRGISVHKDWINSFQKFFDYVGERPSPKHSIDRINNNGNYEPGNVKWSTIFEQAVNKRKRKNTMSKYRGVSQSPNKKKWLANIASHNRNYCIGTFKTEKEAAIAYNEKAKELLGPLAKLNII